MAKDYELQTPSAATALTMSYYTAPYNQALTPLRLSVATRGNAVRDAELRQLVEQDLQMIVASKPELRPAVAAAYATASAEGKHVIERVVEETDPSFLTRLKTKVVDPPTLALSKERALHRVSNTNFFLRMHHRGSAGVSVSPGESSASTASTPADTAACTAATPPTT